MTRPQYNCTSVTNFIACLKLSVGYLEKASLSDLGDFTDAGKTRNAGYNNYTVYWQWYKELGYGNMQGNAYCACGVSTQFTNAFGLEKAKVLLCGNLYVYCPTGYQQFKNKGRIVTTPRAGDVIFFWSDSMGRYSHTGIVIGVDTDGKGYTTWEANTSSGNDVVVRNGGATCIKHYTLGQRTVAFGRPDYEGNGISIEGSSTVVNSGDEMPNVEIYNIATSKTGLKCTASSLNIRKVPGSGSKIGSLAEGEYCDVSKKCFIDGNPWFYIPEEDGWVSAKYLTGWVKESNNRWWYLLPDYKYHTDSLECIDGSIYYLDSSGYVFTGTITFKSNSDGALSLESATAE